jgi:SPP1 gp7 family putative phage head morphogenesis protein
MRGNPAMRDEMKTTDWDVLHLAGLKRIAKKAKTGHWPFGHEQLSKMEAHYGPKVQQALKQMVDVKQVAKSKKVPKKLNPKPLAELLEQIHKDGYFVGTKLGQERLVKRASGDPGEISGEFSWDAWTPGNPDAAGLLGEGGPGLSGLLDDAGVTMEGISDATLEEFSDALAAALEAGQSVDDIAEMLEELGMDPERAEMIARTETARAVSEGTRDVYNANGISQFDWLPADDACEDCDAMKDGNPYDMGDEMPPLHPNCRCAVTPVTESGEEASDEEGD